MSIRLEIDQSLYEPKDRTSVCTISLKRDGDSIVVIAIDKEANERTDIIRIGDGSSPHYKRSGISVSVVKNIHLNILTSFSYVSNGKVLIEKQT